MNDLILPESEENQQLTPKIEKNIFVIALGEPAIESRMQQILGVNPKSWNELKNKGVLPQTGTYGQFLTRIFTHYKEQNDVKLGKLELEKEKAATHRASRDNATESGLPLVVEAEKIQGIRLNKARERQIHLQNLQARNALIDKAEAYELIAPFIGNIVNVLQSAAADDPKLQPVIDRCFNLLYSTAQALLKQAGQDGENYVETLMKTPVDLEGIVEKADLENDL